MCAVKAAIFDAYGTLLDVHSAMARHAARLGPNWREISRDWRARQLEYSWVRSLAGQYQDFWTLTEAALAFAAARHGITDAGLLADIAGAYRTLAAYPEVPAMLEALRAQGVARAILSNGEPAMLAAATAAAGIAPLLDDVLSVDALRVYKPDPRVYRLATERFGLAPAEIAFCSSNAWDAFGARVFGFRVFWINRSAQPDEYGLRGAVTELPDLAAMPALLQ